MAAEARRWIRWIRRHLKWEARRWIRWHLDCGSEDCRVEAGVLILITVRSPICGSAGFSNRCDVVVGGRKKCIKISTKGFCLFLLLPLSLTVIKFVDILEFVFEREGESELLLLLPSFSYRVYIHGRGKGGRFAAPKGLCIVKCKPSLCAKTSFTQ